MKNLLVIICTICLISCGTSKTLRTSKKVIKGDWTLNDISYSEKGTFNVTLLNDVPKDCFENSTWKFIPNNYTGMYTINGAKCNTGTRNFIFAINEIDEATGLYNFLLKPTDEKGKSETNQGFKLKLTALSDTLMQWQQTVLVNGAPFVISMNFSKL